jgi:hypothetical protein
VLSKDWQKINDYCWTYKHRPTDLADATVELFAWEKAGETIWLRDADGALASPPLFPGCSRTRHAAFPGGLLPGMRRLCVLRANMVGLQRSLTMGVNKVTQESYYELDFQVAMSFRQGKLQAKLMWKENVRILTKLSSHSSLTAVI